MSPKRRCHRKSKYEGCATPNNEERTRKLRGATDWWPRLHVVRLGSYVGPLAPTFTVNAVRPALPLSADFVVKVPVVSGAPVKLGWLVCRRRGVCRKNRATRKRGDSR
jgi:hypothetical protein